ncbi:MAG: hypothetical protein ACXQS7_06165 [Candidatus Syntropharchaeia archaeon]
MEKRKEVVKCIFCGEAVKRFRITSGGRVSFCIKCIGKLERNGDLHISNGVITLKRSLLEMIVGYPEV